MTTRLGWMDTARGAAVLAVVAMHAELEVVSRTGAELPGIHVVDELLGPVRMPLLVFLSGLLVPRSLAKGVRSHLRGKVRFILWPYLVWGLLDVAHVQVDALVQGSPLRPDLLVRLCYDPHTYLWFLAYLFVFHLAVTPLPAPGRSAAIPLVFWASTLLPEDGSLHKLVWLFGFFLLGDLATRWFAGRVPVGISGAAARIQVRPLAAVGRSSLVFYACHLIVLTYAVRLAFASGLSDPHLLWCTGVAVTLAVGAGLERQRRRGRSTWLFACPWELRAPQPGRRTAMPGESRSRTTIWA